MNTFRAPPDIDGADPVRAALRALAERHREIVVDDDGEFFEVRTACADEGEAE